jgi:peroxiredoxin
VTGFVDQRLILVLLAGGLIAGVCVYRIQTNRPLDHAAQVQAASQPQPAPLFEAVNEQNEMFRLQSFLGRHRIVVAFYDGGAGADQSRDLAELVRRTDELKQRDVKVVGVSRAIPQFNRAALERLGAFPGQLLSDVDGMIHERWGRSGSDDGTISGLFLIDRKGQVAFFGGQPRSYESVEQLWKDLDQ